jgi:hypothetical protein
MLTVTSTVTINSAFLREIKEDNQELRRLLVQLRTLLADPEWWTYRERLFDSLLGDLRDQLAMHFSLEECYGYFDSPLDVTPRLSARAESLRNQHRELYLEACRLAEEAERVRYGEAPKSVLAELGLKFRDFDARFQYHEALENELLLEELQQDIGVGD